MEKNNSSTEKNTQQETIMTQRPDLTTEIDSKTFRSFYYLKEELVEFCRENNLPVSGGKIELTDRIASFLDTGKIVETSAKRKTTTNIDTIKAYYQILEEKKNGKTTIDKQFEYNTYIRDFFEDNQGKSLENAIVCWKYKKSLPGHNRYERSDLAALD